MTFMKRRSAIKNIAVIAFGAAILPACNSSENSSGIKLKNISVSSKEQEMLAELAEAILPKTDHFPGAKELNSHGFLLMMIDDCSSPEDQKKFVQGLKLFDKTCHEKFGQVFTGFTAQQKKSILKDLENGKNISEETQEFYKAVKHYSLQSFTSSKQYLLDVKKYKMVPGSDFKGCVKITA
jgi:Gluconate 2-dehydrogenase subunit 3